MRVRHRNTEWFTQRAYMLVHTYIYIPCEHWIGQRYTLHIASYVLANSKNSHIHGHTWAYPCRSTTKQINTNTNTINPSRIYILDINTHTDTYLGLNVWYDRSIDQHRSYKNSPQSKTDIDFSNWSFGNFLMVIFNERHTKHQIFLQIIRMVRARISTMTNTQNVNTHNISIDDIFALPFSTFAETMLPLFNRLLTLTLTLLYTISAMNHSS